ncbi:FluC/FEX family fluoride channel [Paenibacillus sp. DMB20]|uniref:FluC/FEX family fluoride channel n=1 Tax=Paenibacillus sp. DMB20 TaxID=1642570 RepID=UPI00069BCE86|nr:CrcB family protein [Paenibacillus sp. DMB20]
MSRYAIGWWLGKKSGHFPWATLLVNASGSFLLGWLSSQQSQLPASVYEILGIGFCGAFTTFSTFGYESIALAGNKRYLHAFFIYNDNASAWFCRRMGRILYVGADEIAISASEKKGTLMGR